MLDIIKIRQNPDAVKAGLKAKEVDCDAIVDQILVLDKEIKALKTATETKTAQKNKIAKENGKLFGQKKGMEKRGEDTSALDAQIEANKAESIAIDAANEEDVKKLADLQAEFKTDFNPIRHGTPHFVELSAEEKKELIARDPRYGNIVCRCETITEGQICDAIHRTLGARSVDGVKRRLRAGMGRCQGGFCGPKVIEILARELGVSVAEIRKNEPGSEMTTGNLR